MPRKANQYVIDPRQHRFNAAYLDPASATFGNAYRSAVNAGYTPATAKDLTHNKPKWLLEASSRDQHISSDELLYTLAELIRADMTLTKDRLKAIEMMMKYHGLLTDRHRQNTETSLEELLHKGA